MEIFLCFADIFFLLILFLYGVVLIKLYSASIRSHPDEVVHLADQINEIGFGTMEEIDRISDKFLNEVFEYITQGDF